MTADADTMTVAGNISKTPMSMGTAFLYIVVSTILLNQLLLYFHYPSISTSLPYRWRRFIRMVTPRITYLLGQSYGSLNRAMTTTRRDKDAPRSGMSRALGLNSLSGFHAASYFSGSQQSAAATGQNPGTSIRRNSDEDEPPGLGNGDNSCYQNSILQGLAALRSIPNYLDGLVSSTADDLHPLANSTPTLTALRHFLDELNSPRNSGRLLWTPYVLKSMSSWQQQDAQEYFSKIVEQLDRELRTAVEQLGRRNSSGFQPVKEHTGVLGTANERYEDAGLRQEAERPAYAKVGHHAGLSASSSTRPLHNPLEGFLAQRVGCLQCGWSEGLSMIPFICLTLPLGRGWSFDLEYCLDEYTKLEHIEGVECARCTLLRAQSQLEALRRPSDSGNLTSPNANSRTSTRDNLLESTIEARLEAVNSALDEEDFSESTLLHKCKINARNRISATKSRQAVIARPPKSLVIHINRSVFDEASGTQTKNYADVEFPKILDLGPWCLDFKSSGGGGGGGGGGDSRAAQERLLEPAQSLLADKQNNPSQEEGPVYQIRAVVTHYGRHENGHYICYRQYPVGHSTEQTEQRWWRLSDDEVAPVTEEDVLGQGGVFMLFYDRIDDLSSRDGNVFVDPETADEKKDCGYLEESTSLPVTSDEDMDRASPELEGLGGGDEEPAIACAAPPDSITTDIDQESRAEINGRGGTTTTSEESDDREVEPFTSSNNLSPSAVPKTSPPKAGLEKIKQQSHMATRSSMTSLVMAN
ncbi:MAG: hypothetical protein M1816_004849 [Peltula sp. TS41687]|nr:MAG: hypothetical protein M1816_004849 [Peltula sp. TS41687]